MRPRRQRVTFIAVGLGGLSLAAWLALGALNESLVFFLTPSEVAAKETPVGRSFRIGGLVAPSSLTRDVDGLTSRFTVTDTVSSIPVVYKGLLPDLFKEGRGCVAQGTVGADGVFYADQVLAKHDENYMPPEAAEAIERAKRK